MVQVQSGGMFVDVGLFARPTSTSPWHDLVPDDESLVQGLFVGPFPFS